MLTLNLNIKNTKLLGQIKIGGCTAPNEGGHMSVHACAHRTDRAHLQPPSLFAQTIDTFNLITSKMLHYNIEYAVIALSITKRKSSCISKYILCSDFLLQLKQITSFIKMFSKSFPLT